ncbi:MAG TPA: twin-arginine translocase TatA/TatE family subunit [Kofleriaceae bacterium]
MGELVIILLIVLVVFGANKLPGIGDALGRSIKNFKRASKVEDDSEEIDEDDEPKAKQVAAGAKAKELKATPAGATADDDGEWEEVVVRRKKKSAGG